MRTPFRFVLLMSIVSLFADAAYEGGRSITGPFLAHLGATGLIVGLVAGLGELIGYGLRVASGIAADRSGKYWPITFFGYCVNVLCVPALALAKTWPVAAGLIVGERLGRGIRKPSVSSMLAHAGSQIGQGWVFGFHEAMDQTGATIGPLVVALILALTGMFSRAFAVLLIPALLTIFVLALARRQYPSPRDLEAHDVPHVEGFDRSYWIYVAAGACIAAGFADFALISYHFSKAHILSTAAIPVLYAAAMLAGVVGAPLFGRLYDRYRMLAVIAIFAAVALFAPLSFLGSTVAAVIGALLWGAGMSAQEALLPPMIANLIPPDRRATAIGTFDAFYGVAWFAGSAAMGALYDRSLVALVVFSLVLQVAALPLLAVASRYSRAR